MSTIMINRTQTLCDALLNQRVVRRGWLFDGVLVVLFSALVALSARITIPLPFTDVPLTGQTLAVLLTGGILGSKRGALALLLYVLEGAMGLPVFAPSAVLPPGIGRLLGPTGGYLWAFPVVAGAVGLFAERRWDRRPQTAVLAMLAGNLLLYVIAVPWLAFFTGDLALAVAKGMVPFIPGDIIKIALAAVTLPGGWAFVHRKDNGR